MLKLIPLPVLSTLYVLLLLNQEIRCISALSHSCPRYDHKRGGAYWHSDSIRAAATSIAATVTAQDASVPMSQTISNNDDESYVELEYMCLKAQPTALSKPRPPMILLHGLLGQKRNFVSIGSALASNLRYPRDIYAVDLRNHGDNTPDDWRKSMTYADMAKDVIAFMDRHSINEAVLVGHSMGGKLAASIALSHSERVAGLIVLDIAPVQYTLKDEAWRAVQDIVDTLGAVNLERQGVTKKELELELRDKVEDPSIREYVLGAIETVRHTKEESMDQLRWKINVPVIIDQMEVLAGFDIHGYGNGLGCDHGNLAPETHAQYDGDAFFINSPTSNYIRGSHMLSIQRYFPNFMVATIRGVGHTMHHEAPEATVSLMKKYLDR